MRRTAVALAVCASLGQCTAEVVGLSGRFTVDMTPPAPPVRIEPVDGDVVSPFVRLAVSASDALSGIDGYHFEVTASDSTWTDVPFSILRDLPNGPHTWKCRAQDRAGNVGDWSPVFSFNYLFGDDQDGDGLPDSWELAFFGSLTFSDGTPDSDEDGFSDSLEAEVETHPFEFELSLRAGWNLLALPCSPSEDQFGELRDALTGVMWGFAGGKYVRLELPEAFAGFWGYAPEDAEAITVSGIPASSNEIALVPGWALHGPGFRATVPDTTDVDAAVFYTEDGTYYEMPLALDGLRLAPMTGYWFHSGSGGSITVVRDWADRSVR